MSVSIVVAMDEQNVIGQGGGLPWHLSADLQNFKKITLGKPIIMGRKTHEAIGRVLPGRENIIITRQTDYTRPAITVYHTIEQAVSAYADTVELMVIGGAELYAQTIGRAQRIYLTRVHASVAGDAWFPAFPLHEWQPVYRQEFCRDEQNDHAFSYQILERK